MLSGFGLAVPVAAVFALLWSLLVLAELAGVLLAAALFVSAGALLAAAAAELFEAADWSDIVDVEFVATGVSAVVLAAGAPALLDVLLWHLSEIIFTSVTCSICCAPVLLVSLAGVPLVPAFPAGAPEALAELDVPVISTVCPTCACNCASVPESWMLRPD